MANEYRRPCWGLLYLILPLTGALFWIESRLRLSNGRREALDVVIVVLVCSLAGLWQHANALALAHLDDTTDRPATITGRQLPLEALAAQVPGGLMADGENEAVDIWSTEDAKDASTP